jgi:hypothetical protein
VAKWAGQSYARRGKRLRRYKDYDLLELFISYYILEKEHPKLKKRGRKSNNPWKSLTEGETLEASLPIYLTDKGNRATI